MSGIQPEELRMPDGKRHTFESIVAAKHAIHVELFKRGTAPNLGDLEGWQYDGRNLSLVSYFIRVRRFIKGFVAAPEGAESDTIDGYNLWARQDNGLVEPWQASSPDRHGFYKVYRVDKNAQDNKYPHALMLNYAVGKNPWNHPSRFLRDYLVQVYRDDPGLLIGNAYFAVGPLRVFGGYFVMRRRGRASERRGAQMHQPLHPSASGEDAERDVLVPRRVANLPQVGCRR